MANTFNHNGKVVITDGGNVGIGTTSPNAKLDVYSGTSRFWHGGTTYYTEFNNSNEINTYASNGTIATMFLNWVSGGAVNIARSAIYAQNAGNVGIGTTSPSYKFTVNESATDPIAYFGLGPTNASSRNSLIILQSGTIPQNGSDTTGEAGFLFKHSYGTGGVNGTANGGYIESIRESVFGITSQVNTALVFGTSSANTDGERMRITSTGNVGIGTTSPGSMLQVGGSGAVASATPTAIQLDNSYRNAVGGNTSLKFYLYKNGNETYGIGLNNAAGMEFHVGLNASAASAYYAFYQEGLEKVRIAAGGNVGIGTTSPAYKLSVIGDAYISSNLVVGGSIDATTYLQTIGIFYHRSDFYVLNKAANGWLTWVTRSTSEAETTIQLDYVRSINASNGGNVGIGTTSPSQKLEVNGNVLATSLIKSGGTSSQYLMADGSVSTTSNVAPRYVQTINVSQTGYTNICTITGDALASAVNFSFQGTSNNVVVNVTAQVLVNHSQDISITSNSGFYTTLKLRIISNNDANYSVEAQVVSGMGETTNINVEVFPQNSEGVTFQGTLVTPGTTLEHTTRAGIYTTATGGYSGNFSAGGDLYVAGNAGIGTTNPNAPLHVIKDLGTSVSAVARLRGSNSTARTTRLQFEDYNGTIADGLLDFVIPTAGSSTGARLDIGVDSAIISIVKGGNVGIGTTSPTLGLHVADGKGFIVGPSASASGSMYVSPQDENTVNGGYGIATDTADIWLNYRGYQDGFSYFRDTRIGNGKGTAIVMVDGSEGRVGIGTTTPSQKLEVNGIIRGEAVNVYGSADPASTSPYLYSPATGALGFGANGSERMRLNQYGQLLINATSSAYSALNYGYNLGVRGTSSQAFISIAKSNQTLDSEGLIVGIDNTTGYVWVRDNINLAFGTNNSEKVTITAGGNVGINTTAPNAKLNVFGAGGSGSVTVQEDLLHIGGNELGGVGGYAGIRLAGTASSSYGVYIRGVKTLAYGNYWNDALTFSVTRTNTETTIDEAMRITSDSNVGIGTTSPNNTLEVAGSLGSGKSTIRITNTDTGNYATIIAGLPGTSNAGMSFTLDGTSKMVIDASGEVGIGTVLPMGPLEVYKANTGGLGGHIILNNNGMAVGNETAVLFNDSGVGSVSSVRAAISSSVEGSPYYGDLKFKTGATSYGSLNTRMIITGAGNVGIGTTSPSDILHVYKSGASTRMIVGNNANYDQYIYFQGNNDWSIGIDASNSNAFTLSNYSTIGTNDRITVTTAGNVGIGTTSPAEKLAVVGNIRSAGNVIASVGLGYSNYISMRHDDNNGYITITRTVYDGNLILEPFANVGISTSSPTEKLHVAGNVIVTYNNSFQGINSIGNKAILARVSPTTGIINYAEYATAANLNGFVLGSDDARVKGDIATDSLDFITNTSSRMFINSSGNVGIATTSPSYKLDVVGDSRITSGSLGVGVAPNATDGRIDASNDIVAYSTSDQRLKENVTPIENALDKVKTLTGVEFDWKEETANVHGYHGHDVGVIAQDVQAVLPEAVRTNDSGYLSVRYEKMIALLIEANKELAARVEELEKKLK